MQYILQVLGTHDATLACQGVHIHTEDAQSHMLSSSHNSS